MSRDVRRIFAENLRSEMENLGLNTSQFAEYLGHDRTTVWAWVNGSSSPPMSRLGELADKLDIHVSDFFREQ